MINFHEIKPSDKVIVFAMPDIDSLIALWVLKTKLGDRLSKVISVEEIRDFNSTFDIDGKIVMLLGPVFNLETMRYIASKTEMIYFSSNENCYQDYSNFRWAYIRTKRTLARVIWDYCHGDFNAPWILDYTENLKRWKWKAHNPVFMQAFFREHKITKEFLDDIARRNPEQVEKEGEAILTKKEKTDVEPKTEPAPKPGRPRTVKKEQGAARGASEGA